MAKDNDKNVEPSKDVLLAYIKGEDCHFFLEFVEGIGVLRVENERGDTIGRLVLGNKRSIDLLEQRLVFLKKLIFKSSHVSSDDVVEDLLSEQDFVGRLIE
ncbi:MAG: hypothetical protein ABIH63_03600 [archaeon]